MVIVTQLFLAMETNFHLFNYYKFFTNAYIYTHWLPFGSRVTFPALVTCSPLHAFDSWGSSVPWQAWFSLKNKGQKLKMLVELGECPSLQTFLFCQDRLKQFRNIFCRSVFIGFIVFTFWPSGPLSPGSPGSPTSPLGPGRPAVPSSPTKPLWPWMHTIICVKRNCVNVNSKCWIKSIIVLKYSFVLRKI